MHQWFKNLLRRKALLLLIAGAIVVSAVSFSFGTFDRSKGNGDYFTEPIQRGTIRAVVDATGTLQALVTVQVGSQVSGQIEALYADYNSVVKHGQLLAKIDPRNFEAEVGDSKANLDAAEAHVQSLHAGMNTQVANLESAKANLEAARVERDNTAMILRRNDDLIRDGLIAQNDLDTIKANADSAAAKYDQAAAAVKVAEAQINSAKAELDQAKAQVQQAQADLKSKEINLAYCNIYSPIDGVIVARDVDVGQTVAASLQAPVLFLIANDLTKMQVNASVDEADIGRISRNDKVDFTVDAYPNKQFSGSIGEIRLNPQTVQNVVTYSVIINVDNSTLQLRPGMTANITFLVASQAGVLRIPNAALRYTPPGVTPQEIAEVLDRASFPAMKDQDRQPAQHQDSPDTRTSTHQRLSAAVPPTEQAPGQLWNPADKIRFSQPLQQTAHAAVVWVVNDSGKPEPKRVMLGITDGAETALEAGDLTDGSRVIVADATTGATTQSAPNVMPFGFGGRRGGRK